MTKNSLHTILGSTGNIGKGLATELRKYTDKIRLVSRNPVKIHNTDELMPVNLLEFEGTRNAISGSDTVYLVTGIEYKTRIWEEQWPVIMKNVIKACQEHEAKLVFFDNMYCYDPDHIGHLTEDTPIRPLSRKGKVRASIASMIMDEVESGNLQAMIVRAADFYGPGCRLSFLHESVIHRMQAGKTPQWLYNASKKHSFTYVPDAVHATAFLAQKDEAWGQVWHLPTSKEYPSGDEIVKILADELGIKPKLQVLPPIGVNLVSIFIPVLKEIKELKYQLAEDYCFDSTKIEKAYGLQPIRIKEGLKACLEWKG